MNESPEEETRREPVVYIMPSSFTKFYNKSKNL